VRTISVFPVCSARTFVLNHDDDIAEMTLLKLLPARMAPTLARPLSTSRYGKTHVWRHRPHTLPKPFVPHFPQRVVLADGSSFVHHTPSPRSLFKTTRDATGHPLWNALVAHEGDEADAGGAAGRMGRFARRFGGMEVAADDVEGRE
jgi:hypothetical protein